MSAVTSQTSTKLHNRSKTYEGEQMTFVFPSTESLPDHQPPVLTGPQIKPYHSYKEEHDSAPASDFDPTTTYHRSSTSNATPSEFSASIPARSESSNFFKHHSAGYSVISSGGGVSTLSSGPGFSTHTLSSTSIPTQDNISYQITNNLSNTNIQPLTPVMEIQSQEYTTPHTLYPHHRQFSRADSTPRRSSSFRRAPSVRRNPSTTRRIPSIKRYLTTIRNENESLYRHSSLKRTKAIKSKIGWLTRLKSLGLTVKTKLKNWRYIAQKKVFTLKRFRNKPLNKNKISMPLERERAQSISELKREMNEWYSFKEPKIISVDAPPSARYKLVDTPPTLSDKKMPPPLPEHRVASNPSMQKAIEERQFQKRTSVFSYTPRNIEVVSISDLNSPVADQKFTLEKEGYPTSPRSIVDEESIVTSLNAYENEVQQLPEDGFDETDEEDEEDEEKEQKEMLYNYWNAYLRKVVAARIESKLEVNKLALIHEPKEAKEYASTMFGLISGSETSTEIISDSETISDTDRSEVESVSSISTSNYSSNATDSSYWTSSEVSTDYYSIHSGGPVSIPEDILKYQQDYIKRFREIDMKRSSSLPNELSTKQRAQSSIPATAQTHARFRSAVA